MSKKKPMDKTQAREKRNRMLDAAAAAELSLTDGVREMRAIAGMTQEEFAQHRGVSARVIKAIELNKGNPTVATLNRIGQFFGLEVAFVPLTRATVSNQIPEFGLSEAQAKLKADVQTLATLFARANDLMSQPEVMREITALTSKSASPTEDSEKQSVVRKNKNLRPS